MHEPLPLTDPERVAWDGVEQKIVQALELMGIDLEVWCHYATSVALVDIYEQGIAKGVDLGPSAKARRDEAQRRTHSLRELVPEIPSSVLSKLACATVFLSDFRKDPRQSGSPRESILESAIRASEAVTLAVVEFNVWRVERQKKRETAKQVVDVRHEPARRLKAWAVEQAKSSSKDEARRLLRCLPQEMKRLATGLKDPERVIYEAIRKALSKT